MSAVGLAGSISSEILVEATSWRQHLHRHPELAYQERQTSNFIAAGDGAGAQVRGKRRDHLQLERSIRGGMEVSQLRRLKDLESENALLKRMFADLSLTHQGLQDAVEKEL